MFGSFGFIVTAASIAIQEVFKDKEYLDSLSDEERAAVLAQRKAEWDSKAGERAEAREHAKKIEIAKAGRSRNFWGNY